MPHDPPRRSRSALAVAPAALTLGNALAGFGAAAVLAGYGPAQQPEPDRLALAATLIGVAMVCDALDGLAARATGTASAFGARLDALADAVSFGVAPALLLLTVVHGAWPGDPGRRVGLALGMAYLAGALLRLARFQVERPGTSGADGPRSFRGLPSPGAAAAVVFPVLASTHDGAWADPAGRSALALAVAGLGVGASALMVSRLRYAHAVSRGLRRRARFGQVVAVAMALPALALWPAWSLAGGALAYAAWGPVSSVSRRLRRRRPSGSRAVTAAGLEIG